MAQATGPKYCVPFKRRRKHYTDYEQRLGFVKSDLPRLVVRKTGKGIIAQFVKFDTVGDKVIASAVSSMLSEYKWPARRNAPTAYLTGMLAGKKAKKNGVSKFILDIGLQVPTKGSILFSALQGAVDAGLSANCAKEMIDMKRTEGTHIADYAKKISGKPEYKKLFSSYIKENIKPENLPELFKSTKAQILSANI